MDEEIVNHRLLGEGFSDYKERIKKSNQMIKKYLKGTLFWDSLMNGTFFNDPNSAKASRAKRIQAGKNRLRNSEGT